MTWLNTDKWEKIWRVNECPMCDDIYVKENQFSHMITEFESSLWRLPKRRQPRGYTMVAAKTHAEEIYLITQANGGGGNRSIEVV